jgi:hypothetical protein
MKRRWWVICGLMACVAMVAFWLWAFSHEPADAVRVRFVGMTGDPATGRAARFCVTNQAVALIVCAQLTPQVHSSAGWGKVDERSSSGLGYLQMGESFVFTVPVPAGAERWRVPVLWQRQELSRSEEFVNRQIGRLLPLFGQPNVHHDAWVPFWHVAYSPEMAP